MNKELEYNMQALVAYSNTERFAENWRNTKDIDYVTGRSQLFLEVFNTFKNKLNAQHMDLWNIEDNDYQVKELIKLLTKRDFFMSLADKGISTTINHIRETLHLKEEIKESIALPQFVINNEEYEAFYEKAQIAYMQSNEYHKRRQYLGDNYAKHGFYNHWLIVGEVFNKLFAKEYILTKNLLIQFVKQQAVVLEL